MHQIRDRNSHFLGNLHREHKDKSEIRKPQRKITTSVVLLLSATLTHRSLCRTREEEEHLHEITIHETALHGVSHQPRTELVHRLSPVRMTEPPRILQGSPDQ